MKALLGMLGALCAVLLCFVLNIASGVFIPMVIAWFILQVLRPVIQLGKALKFPAWVNVILVFTILSGVGLLCFKFFTAQVVEFGNVYSLYSERLIEGLMQLMEALSIPTEAVRNFNWLALLRDNARNISAFVIAFASKFVMTFVFLMFMMLEAPFLNVKIERAFGRSAERVKNILETISKQVSQYLGMLTLISLATGVCAWFVLAVLDVKLAAGWGVLTFLLNFIPTVGSIIATIPPVVMALIQFSPGFFKPFLVLVLLTTIQLTIGNIITPKVVGDRLGVSPVVILLSLLLWGVIWGIPGALLSVPIVSIIKIVCENFPSLRPIAILIGSGEFVMKIPDQKSLANKSDPVQEVQDIVQSVKTRFIAVRKKRAKK